MWLSRAIVLSFSLRILQTTVLAWHDMFGHAMEFDLAAYHMTEVLEPVLWSYAEDLDLYLPKSTWLSLKVCSFFSSYECYSQGQACW